MNDFSRIIKTCWLTAACLAIVLVNPLPVIAQEDTAGTMPVSVAKAKPGNVQSSEDTPKEVQENKKKETVPETQPAEAIQANSHPAGTINLTQSELEQLESYGLLTNISDGGLGIDVWQGSDKSFLLTVLGGMPTTSGYRTTQELLHRALLTRNDISLMRAGGKSEQGNDFLTARIEKLTEMGYFSDAVELYTENPGKPYHERLARAGITAMMLGGQTALACLETMSLLKSYKDVSFWQQASEICEYYMDKIGREKRPAEGQNTTTAPPAVTGKVLQQLIKNDNFRYTVKDAADFEALSHLEKAILVSSRRMDYSSLNEALFPSFSPLSTALFLRDETLPDMQKLALLSYRMEKGLSDVDSLVAFYKTVTFPQLKNKEFDPAEYRKIEDWRQLPYLYQSLAATGKEKRPEILPNALILNGKYSIFALLPFARFLDDLAPADIPPESVRTAMRLYALSAQKAPQPWLEKWALIKTKNSPDIFVDIAYKIATNTSLEIAEPPLAAADFTESKEGAGLQIVNMLKEKLDKTEKLHKDAPSKAYEKNLDLTFGAGYVMPSVSLIDNFEKAEEDRRLGEVIVLSSIALHEVPPAKMQAGLLRKVMGGLETVGLTKEARELAMEVVLGIGNEKEN